MLKKKINKQTLIHIGILLGIYIFIILLITRFKYAYGSTLDWTNQHYNIPDYMRKLFYQTGDIFPSFAQHIGAGENIYNLAYYGLFSPVILFSYLLPFVKMSTYIQCSSIIITAISIILFYNFSLSKFSKKTAFILSLIYVTAAPIIFHSHRHIMFVNYMPFLILALKSIDNYFEKGKKLSITFFALLIILTSWFFSVSALVAIIIYAVYCYLKVNEKFIFRDFLKTIFDIGLRIFISVMIAGILLLPTAYTLFIGRDTANIKANFLDFLPVIKLDYLGLAIYGMGLSAFAYFATINEVMSKEKSRKFLGIVIALLTTCPIFVYILNGTMYFDAKVLIPFIPLAIILIGNTFEDIKKSKIKSITLMITFIAYIIGFIAFDGKLSTLICTIVDIIFFAIFMIKFIKTKKQKYIYLSLFAIPMASMIFFNLSDSLVPKDELSYHNSQEIINLANIINDKNEYVRSSTSIARNETVNKILSDNYYSPYLYSSVHNKKYNNFYFNEMNNENEFRNSALTTRSANVFFNIYMGNKYLIAEDIINSDNTISEPFIETGYNKIASENNFHLYENVNVMPLGYSTNKFINLEDYNNLSDVEAMEALTKCVVIEKEVANDYVSTLKPLDDILLPNTMHIKQIENGYDISLDVEETLQISLSKSLQKNEALIIQFNADNTIGIKEDISVTINGITNTLTNPTWKYYNNNTTFTYVLTTQNKDTLETLDFTFSKGKYFLGNINAYVVNLPASNFDVDAFNIDTKNSKGDKISGTITSKNDGYFVLTIPFSKGFEILVDGKKQEYFCVDTAFIGFPIKKGNHEIAITFTAPFQKAGLILSIVGIFIYIIAILYELFLKIKAKSIYQMPLEKS